MAILTQKPTMPSPTVPLLGVGDLSLSNLHPPCSPHPHLAHTTTFSTLLCHLHIQVPSFGAVLVFETVSYSLGWLETSGPPASLHLLDAGI